MERKINIDGLVSLIDFYDDSLNRMVNLIFEKSSDYFFIEDELEKIQDVSQMPDYIKNDWVKYNSKILNLSVVNKHIKHLKRSIENIQNYSPSNTNLDKENELKEVLDKMFSIRRDFIINGIL